MAVSLVGTEKQLRENRARLITQARGIMDSAQRAGRDMSSEELRSFDAIMDDADALDRRLVEQRRSKASERPMSGGGRPDVSHRGGFIESKGNCEAELRAFSEFCASGKVESRALSANRNPAGGYLLTSVLASQIIQAKDSLVELRQLATKHTIETASSMGCPSLENDPADADWTSELATGNEDSTM